MTYPILDLLFGGWLAVLVTSAGVAHEEPLGIQKCLHARIGVPSGTHGIGRDPALHEEGALGVVRSLAELELRNHGLDCGSNRPRNRHVGCLGRFLRAHYPDTQASSPPGR